MSAKLKLSLVIICLFTNLIFAAGGILPGSGTASNPYLIEDIDDFNAFADPNTTIDHWAAGVYTKLTVDLDLSSRQCYRAPIAPDLYCALYEDFDGTPYSGHFDGNDKTISNLAINVPNSGHDYLALFGYIDSNASISNLYIDNFQITGGTSFSSYCAGLCGYSQGNITNCNVNATVYGEKYIGGICGYANGISIDNCSSTGFIYPQKDYSYTQHFGGVCGYANNSYINNCFSEAFVDGFYYLGGLCGYNNSGSISNSFATGSISGGDYLGGLCGYNNSGSISNSYATGSISGDDYLGSLCGKNNSGSISNCYATGSVSGDVYLGGLCGRNYFGTISNCYATGSVSGDVYLGGLCGYQYGIYANISNSFWDTQTSGLSVGYNLNSGTITNVQGLTTSDMQDTNTFLSAGWDFFGETANGTEQIWFMNGYPALSWQDKSNWVTVPDITGLSLIQAEALITGSGFSVGVISYQSDDVIPEGFISGSFPAAEKLAPPLSAVNLVISLGPWSIVPDVVDLTIENASQMIIDTDLTVGGISYINSDTIAVGHVVNQSPTALSKVAADTSVDLVVSLGPWLTVPDLSGLTQAEAQIAITNAGLTVGNISYACDTIITKNFIISQIPEADSAVASGTQVNFIVSLGVIVPLEGTGTESDPFLIQNMANFLTFSDPNYHDVDYWAEGIHTKLMCNIDLTGIQYSGAPIAPDTDDTNLSNIFDGPVYNGIFDGNEHIIYNLTINGISHCGLFGRLGPDAIVMKIGLENASISSSDSVYTGGICGSADNANNICTISQCYVTGNVTGGGICGYLGYNFNLDPEPKATIINCYTSCPVPISKVGRRSACTANFYYGTLINSYFISNDGFSHYNDRIISHELFSLPAIIDGTFDINTFLDAGWDFVGETANGTDDIWQMSANSYPILAWQSGVPDMNSDSIVNLTDFSMFAPAWLSGKNDSSYSTFADFDGSGSIDISDMLIFVDQWLGGYIPPSDIDELYWPFDEDSGSIAYDSSEYQINGTIHGEPNWVPGIINNCLNFDGIDDYVEIEGYQGIPGSYSRSVAAWIKLDEDLTNSDQNTYIITSWGKGDENDLCKKWVVMINETTGQLALAIWGARLIGGPDLEDGLWHHVAVVLPEDADNINQVIFYVDGVEVSTNSSELDAVINTELIGNVLIGAYYPKIDSEDYSATGFFNGSIDDVRICNYALSDGKIQALAGMPLVGCWPMNESSGTVAPDSTGFGNNCIMGTAAPGADLPQWNTNDSYFGSCLDFELDNGNYLIVEEPNSSLNIQKQITITAWVKPESFSEKMFIINRQIGDQPGTWTLTADYVTNKWRAQLRFDNDPDQSVSAYSTESVTVGQWTHIAETYDGQYLNIYINGQLSGQVQHAGTIYNGEQGVMTIGIHPSYTFPFDGLIDEVKIYNSALSASEITDLATIPE